MKKYLAAAFIAVMLTTAVFAGETKKASAAAAQKFNSEFAGASDVNWSAGQGFEKATFVLDNERMEAFYDMEGDFIGTSRSVPTAQLPATVKAVFGKKYAGYIMKEAIYFNTGDEAAYYISAENDEEKLIVKVGDNNTTSVFKRTRRS